MNEINKIKDGINTINKSPLSKLRDVDFLSDVIGQCGLTYDKRNIYGDDILYMNEKPLKNSAAELWKIPGQIVNTSLNKLRDVAFLPDVIKKIARNHKPYKNCRFGLWQIPRQLAEALIYLSDKNIKSFIEIGTYAGFTTLFIVSYLKKFSDFSKCISIDISDLRPDDIKDLFTELNIDHQISTSSKFQNKKFDLCFIDGNHGYNWIKKDFLNIGVNSKFCMFHDINDRNCGKETVPKFWNELKMNNNILFRIEVKEK